MREWGRGDTTRRRDYPPGVLALVIERQGGRFCEACHAKGLQPPVSEPLEVDHRQPLSKGGDNHWTNLRLLCRSCNRGRNNRTALPEIPRWARGLNGSQW